MRRLVKMDLKHDLFVVLVENGDINQMRKICEKHKTPFGSKQFSNALDLAFIKFQKTEV